MAARRQIRNPPLLGQDLATPHLWRPHNPVHTVKEQAVQRGDERNRVASGLWASLFGRRAPVHVSLAPPNPQLAADKGWRCWVARSPSVPSEFELAGSHLHRRKPETPGARE